MASSFLNQDEIFFENVPIIFNQIETLNHNKSK